MPDLTPKGVHDFWNQYQDKIIYRVVAFLEGVEYWILENNPEIEKAMNKLGQELETISKIDLNKLDHEVLFIDICNAVSSARALRLLQAIDTVHPGSASKMLVHAEESSESPDDAAGLFLRRNIVFERLRLLSRVFTKERVELIVNALAGEEHD